MNEFEKLANRKKKNGLLTPAFQILLVNLLKFKEKATRYWKFPFPIPCLSIVKPPHPLK